MRLSVRPAYVTPKHTRRASPDMSASDRGQSTRSAYYVANADTIKRQVKDWVRAEPRTASLADPRRTTTRPTRTRLSPVSRSGTPQTLMASGHGAGTTAPNSTPQRAATPPPRSRHCTRPRRASASIAASRWGQGLSRRPHRRAEQGRVQPDRQHSAYVRTLQQPQTCRRSQSTSRGGWAVSSNPRSCC